LKLFEYIRLSLNEIYYNKARTFLTLIGIIIGIAAVILIIFVVQGAESFVMTELKRVAPVDLFQIYNRYDSQANRWLGQMTFDDIEFIKEKEGSKIRAIAPRYQSNEKLRNKGREEDFNMISTTPGFKEIYGLKLVEGRFLNDSDLENFHQVVVLGHETAKNAFGNNSALGKKITIEGLTFQVIGVLSKDYESPILPVSINDNRGFIPMTVLERLYNFKNRFSLLVRVKNRKMMPMVKNNIEEILNTRHGVTSSGKSKFMLRNFATGLDMINIIKIVLMLLLGGVASITLLVAGIGVMNIMLVIVAERTREIGLRKALGATRRDILIQFIIESIILCIMGGFIGIILGYLGCELAINLAQEHINISQSVPLWSVLVSLLFTSGVGLFFGVYPALKASRLDPIEALHYE
jgi:putative ABC transport system permease protein